MSLLRDADVLSIRPVFFLRTVRDGLVFLLAVPVFESLELLQRAGGFTSLFQLP
ncbi:hypothetical protein D3C73_1626160 [compost metagenome]